MPPKSFRIAMLNRLRLAPYERPSAAGAPSNEWLILERTGANGTTLFISDTASSEPGIEDDAPQSLKERNTIVGLLASPAPNCASSTEKFLLIRHNRTGIAPAGVFFPADGFAEIRSESGAIVLHAIARHAHSIGRLNNTNVHHDVPEPAPSAQGAVTWHFEACERPWT